MSDHDQNDKELNEYLQGDSDLSTHYKALHNKTPDHLDDTILAAAKRQVKSKPERVSGPFSNNFMIPFATAATILITVGLVNMIPEEELTAPTVSAIKSEPEKMAKLRDENGEGAETIKDHQEKLTEKIELEQRNQPLNSEREEFKSKRIVTSQIVPQEIQAPLPPPMAASTFSSEKAKNKLATDKIDLQKKQGIIVNKSNIASTTANPTSSLARMTQSDEAIEQDTFSDSLPQTEIMSSKPEFSRRKIVDGQDTQNLDELIYNEKKWQEISAKEWLKRIDRLRKLKRNKEVDRILKIFKKKFPGFSPDV